MILKRNVGSVRCRVHGMNPSQPPPRVQCRIQEASLRRTLPPRELCVANTNQCYSIPYDDELRGVLPCQSLSRRSLSRGPAHFFPRTTLRGISYPIQQHFPAKVAQVSFSFRYNALKLSIALGASRLFYHLDDGPVDALRDPIHDHTSEKSFGILHRLIYMKGRCGPANLKNNAIIYPCVAYPLVIAREHHPVCVGALWFLTGK